MCTKGFLPGFFTVLVILQYAQADKLRKCCPDNEKEKYVDYDYDFNCTSFGDFNFYDSFEEMFNFSLQDFRVINGLKCGDGKYKFFLNRSQELDFFSITKQGKLIRQSDDNRVYSFNDYCVEIFEDDWGAFICDLSDELPTIYYVGMIISIPFLVATLVIYSLLPEKKNINTQCQMCYVFSLLCAYCLLISIQLKAHKEGALCTTLGLLCHYSFMTSFCWMNISCVDIFRTFSWQRGFGHSSRSTQMRRFFLYCLYTYGVPLIMIAIILGLNADKHEGAWFHPNFGMGQCWIRRGYPLMLYFYGPMGILLVANIILFILTALKIRQINKDTAMLRTDENKKHYESNKQRFNIYIKLIVVMGINWTLEFLSWLVDWFMAEKKIPELWYVTDMCNALYGVFIFYLFVCKRKIWIMIKKRYYIFMGKPQKARALSTNTNHFQFSQTNTEYLSSTSKI